MRNLPRALENHHVALIFQKRRCLQSFLVNGWGLEGENTTETIYVMFRQINTYQYVHIQGSGYRSWQHQSPAKALSCWILAVDPLRVPPGSVAKCKDQKLLSIGSCRCSMIWTSTNIPVTKHQSLWQKILIFLVNTCTPPRASNRHSSTSAGLRTYKALPQLVPVHTHLKKNFGCGQGVTLSQRNQKWFTNILALKQWL